MKNNNVAHTKPVLVDVGWLKKKAQTLDESMSENTFGERRFLGGNRRNSEGSIASNYSEKWTKRKEKKSKT